MLSERALHEGQNHLFCDDKTSGFRNWLVEVWMSANTGKFNISRFSSDTEEQNQLLEETAIFCVLEIKWLPARDTHFSSSNTTCNICATFCWLL